MKRKIIKQGHNTLTLTIPSKWAKKYSLNAGDEIELMEQENALIINTSKSKSLSSTTLDLRGSSLTYLWRSLISAYRSGYDEITVQFDKSPKKGMYTGFGYNNLQPLFSKGIVDLSPIEAIQALVNRLIGVEIIDQKESYCVIKEMGETTYKEFDNALRRMFLLILNMADECFDGYAHENREPLKQIHLIDTNLDRFEDFCLRVLNKIGYKNCRKTPVMHNIIFLLEMVGDEYKKLALHFLEYKVKPNNYMVKEFEIQKNQLRRFYELFYIFSHKKAAEIYESDQKGDHFLNMHYARFTNHEKEIIHHFKKIGIFVLSLTELRIDLET
ncbi:hypothetical protein JW868_00955 [Candidatus Woesearchaeota archaeon]|nr:hypothetical protein [Candidatus Woesearchaeota archaeon]